MVMVMVMGQMMMVMVAAVDDVIFVMHGGLIGIYCRVFTKYAWMFSLLVMLLS